MNMMALRCGDDMIVADAGMLFPGTELLGVDYVVPDLSYLIENRKHLRGVVVSHCHEDHIGAIPYVLSQLNPPLYMTRFTQALVERRLSEYELEEKPRTHCVKPGEKVELGCFRVEFIQVTHSTADSAALAIETPLGVIIHTADFKIDSTPNDGRPFDLHKFAEYGRQGVLLLLSDSTNADRPGFTPSERAVRPRLEDLFAETQTGLYFSCFSSSVHRVQQILDLASEYGRKVALVGRSVITASELAHNTGYLRIPDGLLMHASDIKRLPPSQRAVIISGSQGEPLSSLARASVGQHRHAVIEPGDVVALSTRIIPGNEKAIFRMIDHLYRRGAEVVYGDMNPPVHVSGHASQEELKLMLNLTRPKYFAPVHGEYRQLAQHLSLAEPLRGAGLEDSFLLQSGEVLEIDERGARKKGSVPVGRICIDAGTGDEILEEVVIRDRRHLSHYGVVVPIVALNGANGKIETPPEIITRGFNVPEDSEELLEGARRVIIQTLETSSSEEATDWGVIEEKIRAALKRYIAKETSSRPLILPVILEM